MVDTRYVDIAVVGAGTAGLAAYRTAKQHTDNVVLIEGGAGGTTCARVGCMPSKLLIAAANAAHGVAHAKAFGIDARVHGIDGHEVMDRVRRERDRFVGFVLKGVDAIPESDKVMGWATLVDAHTLDVSGVRIRAKAIVVATGSSPSYPEAWKDLGSRLVVNDDVFEWRTLPQRVAVMGAGVIGLELGQALHRLGVHVRIFGRSGTMGPLQDEVVRHEAENIFSKELLLDARAVVDEVALHPEGVSIRYQHSDGTRHTEVFDYILAATGRKPNWGLLQGLEALPEVDSGTLQCQGYPHIFIAGDANHERPLLHEAADDGVIAARNAWHFLQGEPVLSPARRAPLGIAFCEPQMAVVGSYSADDIVGEVHFSDQGRSRVMLENRGMLRVYATKEGVFTGAQMVGPAAEHIGHLLSWSLQQGLTIQTMLEMPFYHPVVEEGVRTALRECLKALSNLADR